MSDMPKCQHHWIGDTCTNCGIAWHVFIEDDRDRLAADKTATERELAAMTASHRLTCEGILKSIDASWRPNEARDWGRPELILQEYVSELRARAESAEKALNDACDRLGESQANVAIAEESKEQAEKACAEMRDCIGDHIEAYESGDSDQRDRAYNTAIAVFGKFLTTGRDYVHKSEVTAKQIEALVYCDNLFNLPDDAFSTRLNAAITRLRNGGTLEGE